ncbi:alcohol dehydrogenase catalytic domain-containing protein [Streptomyces sp. NBC_01506]|uniref:alcohol dehydrogenase catalytic domain-containing protein n=1 Tax=Streptomyces sp. NBC_01506 TaxID=2903887 RepID=UPI00386FAA2F
MDRLIASLPAVAARFGITVPAGFGSDFAGVVDEIGDGATGFAVGDRGYGGVLGRGGRRFRGGQDSRRGARRALAYA